MTAPASDHSADADLPPPSMLCAGKITGAYGIKGWVKVHAYTDPIENLLRFDRWWMKRRSEYQVAEIAEAKRHGKGLVCRLAAISDRTAAEALRGTELWVAADELPALESGEYYWHQLQGLRVWCEHEGQQFLVGEVDHLLDTGANDVLVVGPCDASIDDRERLIPYLMGSVVQDIDVENRRIDIVWHPED